MTPRLVPAGARELDAMLDVMADAFDPRYGEAWSRTQLSGTLGQSDSWSRLAVDAELTVGFSLCRRVVDEAELLLVAVRRDRRGQGIGAILLAAAAQDARLHGARHMFLEMRDGNAAAAHLYHRYGFVEVGRRRGYYRGHGIARFDAITMRRDLCGVAA